MLLGYFESAFNTVNRGQFLCEVRHHFPGLAKWAEWCYERPSKLFFNGVVISSEVGVQQGDLLAHSSSLWHCSRFLYSWAIFLAWTFRFPS